MSETENIFPRKTIAILSILGLKYNFSKQWLEINTYFYNYQFMRWVIENTPKLLWSEGNASNVETSRYC